MLYLFSCIRIFFVGGKKQKNVFFISAKNLFSSFLYNFNVLSETLKSNMMMTMFPVTVSACCLCCLNDGCAPTMTPPTPLLTCLTPPPPLPSDLIQTDPVQSSAVNKAVLSVYTKLLVSRFLGFVNPLNSGERKLNISWTLASVSSSVCKTFYNVFIETRLLVQNHFFYSLSYLGRVIRWGNNSFSFVNFVKFGANVQIKSDKHVNCKQRW